MVLYQNIWNLGVSNSLDPGQAQHSVGPDLGPNCLQWLSADDKTSPAWKELFQFTIVYYIADQHKSSSKFLLINIALKFV